MKPWEVLGRTAAPDGTALTLLRHPSEYVIQANGENLMTSREFSSEKELGVLGCARARTLATPHVLIGGLGMGFTLRAVLDVLPAAAHVVVAELVPAVVEWNRTILGDLAGHPLNDPRVRIETADVTSVLRANTAGFDAVLLDVDNGPAALTVSSNASLYDGRGVTVTRDALRPGGILALWSARNDRRYERRLRETGFTVRREQVRGHANRGSRFTVVIATKPG